MGDTYDGGEHKSSRYLSFNGEDKHWREYMKKLIATAKKRGFWEAIEKLVKIEPTDANTPLTEEELKLVEKNDEAYLYLTMSCSRDAFNYVENAGTAYEAWNDLMERYEDLDKDDLVQLAEDWINCKPDSYTRDPKLWYAELDRISKKMQQAGGQKKSDDDMLVHIMAHM